MAVAVCSACAVVLGISTVFFTFLGDDSLVFTAELDAVGVTIGVAWVELMRISKMAKSLRVTLNRMLTYSTWRTSSYFFHPQFENLAPGVGSWWLRCWASGVFHVETC